MRAAPFAVSLSGYQHQLTRFWQPLRVIHSLNLIILLATIACRSGRPRRVLHAWCSVLSTNVLRMRNHSDHEDNHVFPGGSTGPNQWKRVHRPSCVGGMSGLDTHRKGIKRPTEKKNTRIAEAHRVPGDVGCDYIPIRC